MKLSIIVPVYNVESTLDRCLESIVCQTFSDYELILVDDGSPDRCPQLCDEWANRDSRIRVVHKPNGGLSDARNAGLDVAQGDYVTFVDSDDYVDTDTYRQVLGMADDYDLVEYSYWRHYGSKQQTLCQLTNHVYSDATDYWLNGHAYEHTYAWNKVYRRSLFDGVRFPTGRIFEDAWTLPQLIKRASKMATCDAGIYYYCHNSLGITSTAGAEGLSMLLDAHLQVLPDWCDDRYYMHVLNIQQDVCLGTHQPPRLPTRKVNILGSGLNIKQRLKAIILNTFGMNSLCKI